MPQGPNPIRGEWNVKRRGTHGSPDALHSPPIACGPWIMVDLIGTTAGRPMGSPWCPMGSPWGPHGGPGEPHGPHVGSHVGPFGGPYYPFVGLHCATVSRPLYKRETAIKEQTAYLLSCSHLVRLCMQCGVASLICLRDWEGQG